MPAHLGPARYTLTLVARAEGRLAQFGPYVPSINNRGVVAFAADLSDGGSGVYAGDGGDLITVVEVGPGAGGGGGGAFERVTSHPDLNDAGDTCFYAQLAGGGVGVFAIRGGELVRVSGHAGPLGPSMNEAGVVAYRGVVGEVGGVYARLLGVGAGGVVSETIAETGAKYRAFHAIPAVNARGEVVFRAELVDGTHAFCVWRQGVGTRVVADTTREFASLAFFACPNDRGDIVFAGVARGAAGECVFVASGDEVRPVICVGAGGLSCANGSAFESFRGALIDDEGRVVFIATPRGGRLGVFCGPDPDVHGVIGLGVPLLGSTVEDFALNPVSINGAGALGVRFKVADGRQFVAKMERV